MTIMVTCSRACCSCCSLSYLLVTLSAVLNQSAAIYERGRSYSFAEYDGYPHEAAAPRLTVVFSPLALISVISALQGLPLMALIAAQGS